MIAYWMLYGAHYVFKKMWHYLGLVQVLYLNVVSQIEKKKCPDGRHAAVAKASSELVSNNLLSQRCKEGDVAMLDVLLALLSWETIPNHAVVSRSRHSHAL